MLLLFSAVPSLVYGLAKESLLTRKGSEVLDETEIGEPRGSLFWFSPKSNVGCSGLTGPRVALEEVESRCRRANILTRVLKLYSTLGPSAPRAETRSTGMRYGIMLYPAASEPGSPQPLEVMYARPDPAKPCNRIMYVLCAQDVPEWPPHYHSSVIVPCIVSLLLLGCKLQAAVPGEQSSLPESSAAD